MIATPLVFEELCGLGAGYLRLGDYRGRSSDRCENNGTDRGEASIGVEWRPLTELRWVRQRLPHLRRRMAQLPDENECPLLPILASLGARRPTRLVVVPAAHRFFLSRRGSFCMWSR